MISYSPPQVSILLVAYNAENFIEQTIASCLDQSYKNFELLILDNNSSDRTNELISTFKDSRIRNYTSTTNLGAYAGLNLLLDQARGGLIAIQDHDDLWLREKLEQQIDWVSMNSDAVGCATLMYYYFSERQIATVIQREPWTIFIDHPSFLFRKTHLRYKPAHPAPDEEFLLQLQVEGKIGCIQRPLGIHRIHQDKSNLSVRRSRLNIRGAIAHLQLSHWRDLSGALQYVVGGVLPNSLLWWVRTNITMRSANWVTKKVLEERTGLTLGSID